MPRLANWLKSSCINEFDSISLSPCGPPTIPNPVSPSPSSLVDSITPLVEQDPKPLSVHSNPMAVIVCESNVNVAVSPLIVVGDPKSIVVPVAKAGAAQINDSPKTHKAILSFILCALLHSFR